MRKRNERLKAAIFAEGTTQREVSKRAGIPEAYISNIVNGRYVPNDSEIERISKVLGRNPNELFALSENDCRA